MGSHSTSSPASIHRGDGASFLARADAERWDVVVVDAYGAAELAAGFSAPRFFEGVRHALSRGGAMAFNVVGSLAGAGPMADVVAAARAVLDGVRVVPVVEAREAFAPRALRNVVVLGQRLER